MKSDGLLQEALEKTGLPVKQYGYVGAKPAYIVINEEDERGISHADNRPQGMSLWWQVHLFAPKDYSYREEKRKIRNLLLDAGFAMGETETIYEKETGTMHVVMSCSIDEDMEE